MIHKITSNCLVLALALFASSAIAVEIKPEGHAKTAQDQPTNKVDAEMTRKIRQQIMDQKLSTQAKNVTIVTENGHVTLRGEVASQAEKDTILKIATSLTPNVQNQMTLQNTH